MIQALHGKTQEAAAFELGCSEKTLRRWCKELDVVLPPQSGRTPRKPGPTTRPDRATWVQLCESHTCAELQKMFEITYWTVWHWCKINDVAVPGGRAPREKPDEAPDEPVVEVRPLAIPLLSSGRVSYWCQPNIGVVLAA